MGFTHLSKFSKNDELYTPPCLVDIIQPYVDSRYNSFGAYGYGGPAPTIWLPFDNDTSEYAYMCKDHHYNYVASHIDDGRDFFAWEPDTWSFAISNPPFSAKEEVFKRLFALGKPFAMVMTVQALNYQNITALFADNDVQLLIPDKRVSYNGHKSMFGSCYVCHDFLPEDLIFTHMSNDNSGVHFVSSRFSTDSTTPKLRSDTPRWKST